MAIEGGGGKNGRVDENAGLPSITGENFNALPGVVI